MQTEFELRNKIGDFIRYLTEDLYFCELKIVVLLNNPDYISFCSVTRYWVNLLVVHPDDVTTEMLSDVNLSNLKTLIKIILLCEIVSKFRKRSCHLLVLSYLKRANYFMSYCRNLINDVA